jgi:chromosome segregation ATPase
MSESPELAVAAKRVATLENDIANLRRGMVAQLTSSGKLLKAVMGIDGDYFGGRFSNQAEAEVPSPSRDITTALAVVEAVAEELQGASAFADSPLLRDEVANLVAAVESLRTAALDADRFAGEVVGLPTRGDPLPARTFPDNNPLASLKEASGFIRDLQGMIGRIRDRIAAANMMLTEADKARSDAEQALADASPEKLAGKLTSELDARDAELTALRAQSLAAQERHADELRAFRVSLEAKVHTLQEALAREADLRRADNAEGRSLAAEIDRLASADPDVATNDDLEITLGMLREALQAGPNSPVEGLSSSAEAVLVGWARLTGERAASAAKEMSTLRWQLGEAESRVRQADERVKSATLTHARSQSEAGTAAHARSEAQGEVETIRARLGEAEGRLAQREESLRLRDEAVRRLEETANHLRDTHARELKALSDERDALQASLRMSQQGATTGAQDLEAAITRAQTAATAATAAAESQMAEARAAAATLRSELDQSCSEVARLTGEVQRHQNHLEAAQTRLAAAESEREARARDQAELQSKFEQAERARSEAESTIRSSSERIARESEGARQAERSLRDEAARLSGVVASAEADRVRLETDLQHVREERDRALTDLDRQRAAAEVDRRQAADLGAERSLVQERIAAAEARARELDKELDLAKAAVVEAEGRAGRLETDANRLGAELDRLKGQLAAANEARAQATGDAGDKARLALAAAAERDAAKALAAEAQAERQRAAAALERVQAEVQVSARRSTEHENELSHRLADQARQMAEFKLAATSAGSEVQRLKAELERLGSARDQAKSEERDAARRIAEVARQADEARARAATADGQLSGQKRLIAELEGQLAEARAQIGRLEEGHAVLEAQATSAAQERQMHQVERDRAAGLARNQGQQRTEMEALLREARIAVVNAKESIQRAQADNRMVVESLQNEIAALKAKTA